MVLPNIPYVFVFWFANKLGTAYRIADGKDTVHKIAGSLNTLGESMKNIMPSFHPFDLLIGICGVALIFAFVYFKGKNAKKYRKDVEYGSARWGNDYNVSQFLYLRIVSVISMRLSTIRPPFIKSAHHLMSAD